MSIMKRATLNFHVLTAVLVSCGPNAEERGKQASLQAAREDSIRIAVEMETRLRMERKLMLEDSLLREQSLTEGMDNRLTHLQADLVAEKDKLEVINNRSFLELREKGNNK